MPSGFESATFPVRVGGKFRRRTLYFTEPSVAWATETTYEPGTSFLLIHESEDA